jgi:N-acylneuraminate cytidylyltransferase/CMP-N,N'-diacetyllegionaminic acid synthase
MIAIIPARGGSKGLPGKNIRLLGGIPLICHTIKAALNAKLVSRVIVTTDDIEIASVAKECGAEVPFMRPLGLASDNSMVMDAYFYTLDRISKESKESINNFVALLPTVPLRLPEDIDNSINIFNEKKADSVISVTDAPVPIEWYRKIDDQGVLCDYAPEFSAVQNRQELEKTYIPNGAVYVFNIDKLRLSRQYYMDRTYPYIMPKERSADIDEILDFEWAEFLVNRATE